MLQAHVACIDVGEADIPARMVESQPFEPDCWRQSGLPDDRMIRDTAGEYLPVTFLRKGGLAVVSPIINRREKRFGFSLWKLEERLREPQSAK